MNCASKANVPAITTETCSRLTGDIEWESVGSVCSQRVASHTEVLSPVGVFEVGQAELRSIAVWDAATVHIWRAETDNGRLAYRCTEAAASGTALVRLRLQQIPESSRRKD